MIQDTASIVVEKGGEFLLIKRSNRTWRGQWCVPGGHVDEGETAWEGAQREAREEVGGVEVEKEPYAVFVHSVPAGERGCPEPHQHRCHAFKGKVVGKVKIGTDAAEFGWFTLEEAKKLKLTDYTKESINRLLGKAIL